MFFIDLMYCVNDAYTSGNVVYTLILESDRIVQIIFASLSNTESVTPFITLSTS